MDYRQKSLLQRVDGLLEWTGIPKRCRETETKTVRRLKWMPASWTMPDIIDDEPNDRPSFVRPGRHRQNSH